MGHGNLAGLSDALDPGSQLRALEAVQAVADKYGIPTAALAPCVAVLLDGNLGEVPRHDAAWIIAISLRGQGLDEKDVTSVVIRWARALEYPLRDAQRAVRDAFKRGRTGEYAYRPPGLVKKPGTKYEPLGATCADVGCPANCPPMASRHQGDTSQTLSLFRRMGWPEFLHRRRQAAAAAVYEAVCARERELGLAPGAPLRISYAQLAAATRRERTTVGRALRYLAANAPDRAALILFTPGSGSGPLARDRTASEIKRVTPIPEVPPPCIPPHKNRLRGATHIGCVTQPPASQAAPIHRLRERDPLEVDIQDEVA